MLKFGIFINTDTIKDLMFVEAKVVGSDLSYAEITKTPKGISATIFNSKIVKSLDWETNMYHMRRGSSINKDDFALFIEREHLDTICEYHADGQEYEIEWHFIDIDFRNMIDEINVFLDKYALIHMEQ